MSTYDNATDDNAPTLKLHMGASDWHDPYLPIHRVIVADGGTLNDALEWAADGWGVGEFYLLYNEDGFSPALYLVLAESFESAYDAFLCDPYVEQSLAVDDADLPPHVWDYGRAGGAIRQCTRCGERETYWDDNAHPDNPCRAGEDWHTYNDNGALLDAESVMGSGPIALWRIAADMGRDNR
jgi:hypothetical protein